MLIHCVQHVYVNCSHHCGDILFLCPALLFVVKYIIFMITLLESGHCLLLFVQDEDNIHMPKSKRVKRSHVAFIDD